MLGGDWGTEGEHGEGGTYGQKEGQGARGKPRQGHCVNETAKGLVECKDGQGVLERSQKQAEKDQRVRAR